MSETGAPWDEPRRERRVWTWVLVGLAVALAVMLALGGSCYALARRGLSDPRVQGCVVGPYVDQADGILLQLREGEISNTDAFTKLGRLEATVRGQSDVRAVLRAEGEAEFARFQRALGELRGTVLVNLDAAPARARLRAAASALGTCPGDPSPTTTTSLR